MFLPPTSQETVSFYNIVLSELTFNSKPIINELTIIAGDEREHAQGIAAAISSRILEVFCEAYRKTNPSLHHSMRRLFGTWSQVFPSSVLRDIEAELQFSPTQSNQSSESPCPTLKSSESPWPTLQTSESPRPTTGILFTPKYAEEMYQFKRPTTDDHIQYSGGTSSLVIQGKHTVGYDFDNVETIPTFVAKRLSPTDQEAPCTSSVLHMEKLSPSANMVANSSSSFSLGHLRMPPSDNEFNIPNRIVESISAHLDFGYEIGGTVDRDEEATDWKRSRLSNNSRPNGDIPDECFFVVQSGRGLVVKISEFGNKASRFSGSLDPPESWNFRQNLAQPSQNSIIAKQGVGNLQLPIEQKLPIFPGVNVQDGLSTVTSKLNSSKFEPLYPEVSAVSVPASADGWPHENALKRYLHPSLTTLPMQKQIHSHFDFLSTNANVAQGLYKSFPGQQQLNIAGHNAAINQLLCHQLAGPIPLNQQHQAHNGVFQTPWLMHQKFQPNLVPPTAISTPSHLCVSHFHNGYYIPQSHRPFASTVFYNPNPSMHLPGGVFPPLPPGPRPTTPTMHLPGSVFPPLPPGPRPTTPNMHLPGEVFPPLPLGPRPASLKVILTSQNPTSSALQPSPSDGECLGSFSSLMAQSSISLPNQAPMKDHVGLEFSSNLLKVRYESAITALYADLPRQCTPCGLRFKCQEEHSSHMDWHVIRNRTSKNHTQKPFRKLFVDVNMWLSGAAALGADSVPGFLSTESVSEKKDDEEMVVPADEDQNACALCGEPFDYFYSDETEEWMYRGAVFMNASTRSTVTMDRSNLGPIVHGKCWSESNAARFVNFCKRETMCNMSYCYATLRFDVLSSHFLRNILKMVVRGNGYGVSLLRSLFRPT